MCGLCGIFQTDAHWTDAPVAPTGEGGQTRRRERQHRVEVTNRVLRHYGLKLSDWSGTSYIVSTQTGQSEIISNIAALWPVAEALRKRPLDPLDETLVGALESDNSLPL